MITSPVIKSVSKHDTTPLVRLIRKFIARRNPLCSQRKWRQRRKCINKTDRQADEHAQDERVRQTLLFLCWQAVLHMRVSLSSSRCLCPWGSRLPHLVCSMFKSVSYIYIQNSTISQYVKSHVSTESFSDTSLLSAKSQLIQLHCLSSSSSCRAPSMCFPDPLSLPVSIVHCSRRVFQAIFWHRVAVFRF